MLTQPNLDDDLEQSPANSATSRARRLTVVAVTPTSLRADSRTLKQAASLARAGHRSIVVEGRASDSDYTAFGIEVIAPRPAPSPAATLPVVASAAGSPHPAWRRWASRLRHGLLRGLYDRKTFTQFLFARYRDEIVPVFRRMPPADLYVLHSFQWLPAVRLRCFLHRVPYIYDAHDYYRGIMQPQELNRWTREWMLPFYARTDRAALRHASAAMTATAGTADLYKQSDGIRPTVLRNAHDPRLDRVLTETLRQRLRIAPDTFLVVSTGNYKPGMGLELLLPHVQALPASVHFAFVGAGFESLGSLGNAAAASGRIHFVPAVPAESVVPLIKDADAALILLHDYSDNYRAALPNRFFQAIAAGLPLLYPALPEIQHLARRYRFGIEVDTQSIDSICEGVRRLQSDPGETAALARAALAACSELSWLQEELVFLDVVHSVMKRQERA